MYPEQMVAPMRQDLTKEGVVELRTAEEVEQLLSTEKVQCWLWSTLFVVARPEMQGRVLSLL